MISVAIPAYKSTFLKSAIESVIKQSFTDFELIIVDDDSPFELEPILNEFDDARITYFRNQHNLGKESVVRNWNKCLEYAKGDFFVLFSDDDLMEQDFLSEMVELSNNYPNSNIFHSRVKKINSQNEIIGYTPLCPPHENIVDFIWHVVFEYRNIYATEFMCRTNVLKENGGFIDFPLAWGSDYATYIQLASKGGVAYSSKPLSSWRSSSENISNIGNISLRLDALNQYENWLVSFINNIVIQNEKDHVQLAQIEDQIGLFFQKKREYLFQLQLKQYGLLKSLISKNVSFSSFQLPKKNIALQIIKNYSKS